MEEIARSSAIEYLIYFMNNKIDLKNIKMKDGEIYLSKEAICTLLGIDNDIDKLLSTMIERNNLDTDILLIDIDDETFYSLDMLILLSCNVNSEKAIQLKRWSIGILKKYIVRGYILDDERLSNSSFLASNLKETKCKLELIGMSQRNFYQKIADMYETSIDYDGNAYFTRTLYIYILNQRNNRDILLKDKMVKKLLEYAIQKNNNQIPMTMNDWNNLIRKYALLYDKNTDLYEYTTDFEKVLWCG
ncbi:MAG: virulence RhuM family protein [Bacilli bacterium]|nr:virulence RhuM family protein [Bacilli bacterium]